jgi:hypothetical protein
MARAAYKSKMKQKSAKFVHVFVIGAQTDGGGNLLVTKNRVECKVLQVPKGKNSKVE